MKLIKSAAFKYVLFAVLVGGFFTAMQFVPSDGFSDPDGHYHAGAAKLIQEGKLGASFPWAYFSTLRENYGDQHYVYHLLLIPMSSLVGMHVSVALFSSLMVLAFVWLLRQFGVRYAWVWGAGLVAASVDFLFRINVVKANTLSLVLIFAGIWLLAKRKYAWLLPLSALFVWVYGGFVFLPVIAGAYVASYWFVERKLNLRPFVYVVLGIAAGMAVHPHFPGLATHLYYQLFHSGLGAGLQVPVGGEWNPYSIPDLISANGLAIMGFIMASAVFVLEFGSLRKKGREGTMALFLWLTAIFFFLLTIRSRRFVEYSIPFCVLFTAYAANKIVSSSAFQAIREAWRHWHIRFFTVVIAWVIILTGAYNISRVEVWLKDSYPPDGLKPAALWLKENTESGEIIFNTKWDDLPQLFYWNPDNYYIIGLDPTFMYVYDKDLYWDWRMVADDDPERFGNSYPELRRIVKERFNSSYIVLEHKRDGKLEKFLDEHAADGAEQVFSDDYAAVYRID